MVRYILAPLGGEKKADPEVQPTIKVDTIDKKKIVIIEVKENLDKLVLAFGRPFKWTDTQRLL